VNNITTISNNTIPQKEITKEIKKEIPKEIKKVVKQKSNMMLLIFIEISIIAFTIFACTRNARQLHFFEKEKKFNYNLPIYVKRNGDLIETETCYRRIPSREVLYNMT